MIEIKFIGVEFCWFFFYSLRRRLCGKEKTKELSLLSRWFCFSSSSGKIGAFCWWLKFLLLCSILVLIFVVYCKVLELNELFSWFTESTANEWTKLRRKAELMSNVKERAEKILQANIYGIDTLSHQPLEKILKMIKRWNLWGKFH